MPKESVEKKMGSMAHACNLSFLGSLVRKTVSSKPAIAAE